MTLRVQTSLPNQGNQANATTGKTPLLYELKLGKIVTTIPTTGFNVETIKYKKFDYTF